MKTLNQDSLVQDPPLAVNRHKAFHAVSRSHHMKACP